MPHIGAPLGQPSEGIGGGAGISLGQIDLDQGEPGMMGTRARAFPSSLLGLPLAGASSAASTSPRELAVSRKPTPSLGQPQESSQGWDSAVRGGLAPLPPSSWSRRLDL